MLISLRNYDIKLIAAASMLIDHVGYTFFPEEWIFRIIGRLSFPLFAWLLVQGEAHTKNVVGYGLRLLGLAIASQFVYNLHSDGTFTFLPPPFNILFTLLLGLICLRASRLFPRWQVLVWVLGFFVADITQVEYGSYGLTVILLMRFIQPALWWWLVWVAIHFVQPIIWWWLIWHTTQLIPALAGAVRGLAYEPEMAIFQSPAMLAAVFLLFANHRRGPKARWFYLFYPVHLLVLFGLAAALGLRATSP